MNRLVLEAGELAILDDDLGRARDVDGIVPRRAGIAADALEREVLDGETGVAGHREYVIVGGSLRQRPFAIDPFGGGGHGDGVGKVSAAGIGKVDGGGSRV